MSKNLSAPTQKWEDRINASGRGYWSVMIRSNRMYRASPSHKRRPALIGSAPTGWAGTFTPASCTAPASRCR